MNTLGRLAIVPIIVVTVKSYYDHDYLMVVGWGFLILGNILFWWLKIKVPKP